MQPNLSQSHKQPIGIVHHQGEGGRLYFPVTQRGKGGKIVGPVGPISTPGIFHIPRAGEGGFFPTNPPRDRFPPAVTGKLPWEKTHIVTANGGSIAIGGRMNGSHKEPIGPGKFLDPSSPIDNPRHAKMAESFKLPENAVDAYHYLLNMSPQQLELKREIASQVLGGVPSKMWGKLIEDGDKNLEADPEHYENVIRMPNSHSMARMLEAEHNYGEGGGFMDTLKHVGRIASKAYKTGRTVGKFLYANRTPLLQGLGLQEYAPQVDEFANRVKNFDEVLNPLADKGLKLEDKKKPSKPEINVAPNTASKIAGIPSISLQKPLNADFFPSGR